MGSTLALPPEDLRQIGSLGLLRAIEAFEPARGRSLSSFAVPYIRGAIQHELRDRFSLMRIPRPLWDLRRRAVALQDQRRRLGLPQLAPLQLAEALGCPAAQLVEAQNVAAVVEMRSLDAPSPAAVGEEGDGRPLIDLLPDPASLERSPETEALAHPSGLIDALLDAAIDEPPGETVRQSVGAGQTVGLSQAVGAGQGVGQGQTDGQGQPVGRGKTVGVGEPVGEGEPVGSAGPPAALNRSAAAMSPRPDPAPLSEVSLELQWLHQRLLSLTPQDRSLVLGHVCRGLSWVALGRELGIHPRQTQRRTLALLHRLQVEARGWRQEQDGLQVAS